MSRKYEYATTSDEAEEEDGFNIAPIPPDGDDWEMCGSNVMVISRAYRQLITAIWFWKREVSK